MTIEKPREYWISEWHRGIGVSDAVILLEEDRDDKTDAIHVIEKSHADLLERKLKAAMEALREAADNDQGDHPFICEDAINDIRFMK